jgi:hypothetical protein
VNAHNPGTPAAEELQLARRYNASIEAGNEADASIQLEALGELIELRWQAEHGTEAGLEIEL